MTPILKRLTRRIFNISNHLKKLGGYNENEFILQCNSPLREVLGESFKIGDYSYKVILDSTLPETDAYITMKAK